MNEEVSRSIEITREQAQKRVELYESLQRLCKNDDFKKVIEDEYLEKEAIRLVHLKSHPAHSDVENQKAIDNSIIGIGELRQFFVFIMQDGLQKKQAIQDCDDELSLIDEESI